MAEEPTENSPLKPDFRGKNNPPSYFEEEKGQGAISYATWSTKTWHKWSVPVKGFVLVLGVTLMTGAIYLIASTFGSSSSPEEKNVKLLRQEAPEEFGIVLEIPQGQLKWNVLQSRGGRDYYAFYKVPYAKPPINDLRFESPQPPEPWEGVRHETKVAPQCLQKVKYSSTIESSGVEDCLYANIYSPKLPGINLKEGDELLPTLFYIHGGGFTDGNGSRYGAKYFMQEDVVLITFQYRLGIFGFLSSEDGTIKGNMAMKDQIQALKWTKDNIRYFGGDPDRVMICGNSAGAISVDLLVTSPMAKGLYHRAITQSGFPFGPLIVSSHEAQLKSYEALATQVGCWSRNKNEQRRNKRVLKCLREQNASDIAVLRGPEIVFGSTIETYETEDESDKFISENRYNLFKTGKVNKIPWLIGVNSAEWLGAAVGNLLDPEKFQNLNNNWTSVLPTLGDFPFTNSSAELEIAEKARQFYFGDKPLSNDTMMNLTYLLSDRDIIHGSKVCGQWMSDLGVEVFFYYLSKRPQKSYTDKILQAYPEYDDNRKNYASHADELQYLFNYSGYPEYLEGSEYYDFSRNLVKIWVQFASRGKPGWDPALKNSGKIPWYELNDKSGYTNALDERMQFWDQFTDEELLYNL